MDSIAKIYKLLIESSKKHHTDLGYEYDYENPVSIKSLTNAFDEAIAHHLSLKNDPAARRQNSRNAKDTVEKYLGSDKKTGETKQILTTNGKLIKASNNEAVKLDDGSGIQTIGMFLAPAYRQGKFTTCPNSASCEKACLGKTSGGYFQYGGGSKGLFDYIGPGKINYLRRTHALLANPKEFAVRLNDEINIAKYKAEMDGDHLGVRLNSLSDIHPRVFKSIMNAHPDVTFYDYTKNNVEPIAPNHHITYSSTGVSQPAGYNGLKESVENPHSNWRQMRKRLEQGHNVAMSFSHKSILPKTVHDEETGKTYHVVSGDEHDFRPLDGKSETGTGYIIGLKNKAKDHKESNAAKKSNGFFVHYDPQIVTKNGVQVKDSEGNPVYKNTNVVIAKQKHDVITLNNDREKE